MTVSGESRRYSGQGGLHRQALPHWLSIAAKAFRRHVGSVAFSFRRLAPSTGALLATAICTGEAMVDFVPFNGPEVAPNDDPVRIELEVFPGDLRAFEGLHPDDWIPDVSQSRASNTERLSRSAREELPVTRGAGHPLPLRRNKPEPRPQVDRASLMAGQIGSIDVAAELNRGFAIRMTGGGIARIVTISDLNIGGLTPVETGYGFQRFAAWTVDAHARHRGYDHRRILNDRAIIAVVEDAGAWKLEAKTPDA